MNDREKVIKGLECAIGIRGVKDCDNCPYDYDFNCLGCDIVMRDALALLKEQEPVEPRWTHPEVGTNLLMCGGCGIAIPFGKPNYCPWCGKEVKWDD